PSTPTVPSVDAGDVATVVLQLPAPDSGQAVYRLELQDGYQPFIPLEGTVGRVDGVLVLPITFATPRQLAAGRVVAGHVAVEIEGRPPLRREVAIRVRERREVTFALDAEEITVAPDAVAGVPFRAHNRGNLTDTLYVTIRAGEGWTLLDSPRLVLEPGDSVGGAIRVASPVSVVPGERELLLVDARTVAGQETRTLDALVVSPEGWLGDLARVPGSVFVGQQLQGDAGPVLAVTGGGKVGPETEVRVDLRHADPDLVDPALQRQVAGARLRASLTRPDLVVVAGDVYDPETTLSGSLRQGRGIRSSWDPRGPLSVEALAAAPTGFGGQMTGGHMLHGEIGLETDYGRLDALVGDIRHPERSGLVETRTTGAGARWSGRRGRHEGIVETSIVRFVAADSLVRTGPAVDLRYLLSGESMSGRLRVRRVPDAAAGPGGLGNQLSGSFSAAVRPDVHFVAWGYRTDQNLLGNASRTRSSSANVGIRTRKGRWQLQLGGLLSDRATRTAADSFSFARATVRTEATWTRGSLSLQSDLQAGRSTELGATGGYQALGGSVRWYGAGRWGWLRLVHTRRPGSVVTTNLNAGGAIEMGPVHVTGGLSTPLSDAAAGASFWSSTEIRARRNLTVHIGASARPTVGAGDWTLSLGVSRRLNLPLPLARHPDLHGIVYDDANDNGTRDPGEQGIPDVTVSLGHLETTTDDEGRFEFRDASGARLRLSSADLPAGYIVSPAAVLPARGDAAIPVLRTATLQLHLFIDRDEDGRRDAAEGPGAGAIVTLTDEHGRQRTVAADSTGTARITGLLPGRYDVTARPASATPRPGEPRILMEIELEPGSEAHHTLPVPLRRRTIRMGGDDGGFQFFDSDGGTDR
ncbi:MAG: SdrD B-like domain-containing protein, partial [Longimicrobiales bacterium]|nr:SdrD B-like domain-containing protein [Longimicrobiales bacterium]